MIKPLLTFLTIPFILLYGNLSAQRLSYDKLVSTISEAPQPFKDAMLNYLPDIKDQLEVNEIPNVVIMVEGQSNDSRYVFAGIVKTLYALAVKKGTIKSFVTHEHAKKASPLSKGFDIVGYFKDFKLQDINGNLTLLGTFVPTPAFKHTEDWQRIVWLSKHAPNTFGVSVYYRSSGTWPDDFRSIDWVSFPAGTPGIFPPK